MTDPRDARVADGLTDALKYIAQLEKCDELEAQLAAAQAETVKVEWAGYIIGLTKAINLRSRFVVDDTGGRVLNDIRAQIEQEIKRAEARSASPATPAQEEPK